ncbi:MAG TPA: DciA family protein, partial [Pararhizobium sp.]|nr:DciA family protein [Pararhizobium sp.]
SWDEIAGQEFADCTRPEQIKWPRHQPVGGEGGFAPGVLTVACESARALFLMHAEGEMIQRINAFFGFPAINRLRIVQKPVAAPPRRPRQRVLSPGEEERLAQILQEVDDPRLKASLEKLGRGVLTERSRS